MPASYQAPTRGDAKSDKKTVSQSVSSNLTKDTASVRSLLSGKGGAVFSVSPDDTLADAVTALRDKGIGALVVTDSGGALQGILSERDIVRKLAETPGQTLPQKVSENMTKAVETCTPDDPLIDVLRRMSEGKFRHMPVLENGALSGMITIGDVVNFRLKELEHEALQLKQMIVG
ncbi:MAG: CBS domain-containing protein [Dinoroseobacter sp.]|nr:CBS domain-containing protein [Dinoroseobacter sp.]MDJ0992293.1 CBS domain-containing protein [Dinoroseobacter sp.]